MSAGIRSQQQLLLSFDVDWAPDWAVERCASMCLDHNWQATFFVTHESKIVDMLKAEPQFEVGIHPNFASGSTHGGTPQEVIQYCLELVPDATSMRSHGFISSAALSTLVATRYRQIEVDTSVFLPFQSQIEPVRRYLGSPQTYLAILPTWLSDMSSAQTPGWSWTELPPKAAGICLVNVHPIHVALNSRDGTSYGELKRTLRDSPLSALASKDVRPFVNKEEGVATWLRRFLKERSCAEPGAVTEFVREWFRS